MVPLLTQLKHFVFQFLLFQGMINTHKFVLQWFDLSSIAINCIETMENNELF